MSIRDKILIYCDFFPSSGVGHLKRCIVLAKELYKRGLDPTFLISSNVGEPPIALPFHIERCSLDNKSILSAEEIIKLAYRDRVQTVIIDSYKISENWISKLISANLTVVAIDDLGIAGNATMRIDYSPNPKLITENCLNLLGPKYFLTDSTSKVYRSMTPQKIIAHAGSLGNFADAPIIYLTAARVFKTFGFEISWLSPNKVSYQWLEENELITDRDLEKLQNSLETQFVNRNASIEGIANSLSDYYTFYGDTGLINSELDIYRSITKEEIRDVAKKYLNSNQRVIVDYLPGDETNKTIIE